MVPGEPGSLFAGHPPGLHRETGFHNLSLSFLHTARVRRVPPCASNAVQRRAKLDDGVYKQAIFEGIIEVAAHELKNNGSFKFAAALNLKLKKKPACAVRKDVNPFTQEPCAFEAKPASKIVRALPMKKLKEMMDPDMNGFYLGGGLWPIEPMQLFFGMTAAAP